jgi:hypothetical protein
MTSKYALVQFYPDPASSERLDIGVIAWDADSAHVVFIESWERVGAIGLDEVYRLQAYAQSLQERLSDRTVPHLDESTGGLAEHVIGVPAPGVRLTPARNAPEDAPTLIASLATHLHYGPAVRSDRTRGRLTAASRAYRSVLGALRKRAPADARRMVHARHALEGRFARHQFDVVLARDEPLAAVAALSFEVRSHRALQREVDATAWALEDVHKLRKDLPLAVFILPPADPETEALRQAAARVFKGVGARMIDAEPAIARWALRHAGLPASQGQRKGGSR